MKSIGIVICNYNKKNDVLHCIQSVLESKIKDIDIYVVDNASTDGSVKAIQKTFGNRVRLIVNHENLGGSGGFNIGLKKALAEGYPYLMCIDNDVLVDEDAIGKLYDFLESHDQVGMVGSKVYHMENPDYVQQFGITIDFDNFCVKSKFLNHLEDGTMPDVVYSDSVAACSLMVRSSVVKEIGVMPEDNFLYWDDTEWGYLCNLAGYKVASYGKSKVLHEMGAKKENENTFPTYYAWRNWINFFIKYTPEEKLAKMTSVLLGSVFDIIYESIYNGQKNKMKTVLYAYDDAIHQILGKASEDKIFSLEHSNPKLVNLIQNKHKIFIDDNRYQPWGRYLFESIKKISPYSERVNDPQYSDIRFTVCESIFKVKDFRLDKIYVDIFDNIFATEDDANKIKNYQFCKQNFLYAQQPLFLYRVKKIRGL